MKFCPECERDFSDDYEVCPKDGAQLVFLSRDEDLLLGTTIDDRYTLEERIGEGGMGAVYVATQAALGRSVAVKVLRRDLADDPSAVKRFFHEAKVVSRLRHPNTITLYDFGQSDEGLLYIAMEYMTGRRLDYLIEEGALNLMEILEISEQICQSLIEAHDNGIVHRDLKPENVFIDAVGQRNIVKVLDFGIAKVQGVKSNLTLTGMVFGTPAYMSPEQAQGFQLDKRTDIYSLGVVLFEMICGRLPYQDTSAMRLAMKHILNPIPSLSANARYASIPAELEDLVTRMLAKTPDDRPASAGDVRRAISRIMRDLESSPPESLRPRTDLGAGDDFDVEPTDILVRPDGALALALRERKAVVAEAETPLEQTGPNRQSEVYTTAQYRERERAAAEHVPSRRSPTLARLAVAAAAVLVATTVLVVMTETSSDDEGRATELMELAEPPELSQPREPLEVAATVPDTTTPESTEPNVASADIAMGDETLPMPAPALLDGSNLARELATYLLGHAEETASSVTPGEATPEEWRDEPTEPLEEVSIGLDLQPSDASARLVGSGEVLCEGAQCAALTFPWGIEPVEIEIHRRRYNDQIISFVPDHQQSIRVRLRRSRARRHEPNPVSEPAADETSEPVEEQPAEESTSPLMNPVTIP